MAAHIKDLGSFRYKVDLNVEALSSQVVAARDSAIKLVGENIRQRSTAIAPLREGTLIAGAEVRPKGDGKIEIGYYGVIYANYQHEGVDFHHPNGRQAKYLESVVNDDDTQQAAKDIFAAELRAQIGG